MKAPIPSMTNDQRDYSYLLTYLMLEAIFSCHALRIVIQRTFYASGNHYCIKSK